MKFVVFRNEFTIHISGFGNETNFCQCFTIFTPYAYTQLLDEVSYQPEETAFSDGKDPSNIAKNRYPNILPCKCTRKINC